MSTVAVTIKPYWHDGMWVFDDLFRGLLARPLIAKGPEIIDHVLRQAGLLPRQPFTVTLGDSKAPAIGYRFVLEWAREDAEGHWYQCDGLEGLCPAIVRFFGTPPKRVYCQLTARRTPFSVITRNKCAMDAGA